MDYDRRQLLRLSGLTAIGALAGCSSSEEEPTEDGTETGTGGGVTGTPGRDQLGGPENLQASASVDAAMLDADQGAGQYVFSPAVVWLEPGGTVAWSNTSGSHSITAYHPDNGKSQRIPEGATAFDSGTQGEGETYSHSFETEGVYNYYCKPHEGLGMVGLVIVGSPQGGPGTTAPDDVEGSTAADNLAALLNTAGITESGGGSGQASYGWQQATFDSYWYSLYNMSTNIAMNGNGVLFPHNEKQRQAKAKRFPKMLEAAGQDKPPVKNPNLNQAPFTSGDPHFTQKPVLSGEDGRPDASTLKWDLSKSSKTVSPSSLAWTHLKGVTWAKNFQAHFETLPPEIAPRFRSEVLATMAQLGIMAGLVAGGPQKNGGLTNADGEWPLVSGFSPPAGEVTDPEPAVDHHSAMLWFLSDMVSLATGGWFGYENPEPLLPPQKIKGLADTAFQTTRNNFAAGDIESTRDVGQVLGATAWYGSQTDGESQQAAVEYANALAGAVESNLAGNGLVENGAENQAATQGIVGQGLLWASELDGVDHTDTAAEVLGYMTDELWDAEAGTFKSAADASTYTITARDAGDITGGLNAADAVLGMDGVKPTFATFFNQTFNRGRLQRAERPASRNENAEYPLPLPQNAGGEYGQAAVYNAEVEYDSSSEEWSVTDDSFDTEGALYLANQDIWIGNWAGDFFQGRGRPGHSDSPPEN